MIATLTFNLPEEAEEHRHAVRAVDYVVMLDSFNEYLIFQLDKYRDFNEIEMKIIEEIRDKWKIITNDFG